MKGLIQRAEGLGRVAGARDIYLSSKVTSIDLLKISSVEVSRLDFPEQRARKLCDALGLTGADPELANQLLVTAEQVIETGKARRRVQRSPGATDPAVGADEPSQQETSEEARSEQAALEDLKHLLAREGMPEHAAYVAIMAARKLQSEKPRHGLLLEALLTTAVSQFETLLERLMWTSLALDPKPLGESGKSYSLKEVAGFGSISHIVAHAIEARVDDLMRDSLNDWLEFLSKATRVELGWIYEEIAEIFGRRNVHVHANGRVSRQYVDKLGKLAASTEIGQELPVTEAYLQESLDKFAMAAIVLSQAAIAAIQKGSTSAEIPDYRRDGDVVTATFDLLVAQRYRALQDVSDHVAGLISLGTNRERVHANSLWARLRLYGLDATRPEIERWDVSAAEDELRLAKHCMLDDMRSAMPVYTQLRDRGRITLLELSMWPILEPLRVHLESAGALLDTASVPGSSKSSMLESGRDRDLDGG